MLLLKVVNLSHPPTAYILALANSFGGSLIIIGSVSNIIVVQQARDPGNQNFLLGLCPAGHSGDLAALAGLLVWIALVT